MVGDAAVDFAFSFDSLVHVEAETLADYLAELARVLVPDGVGFLHHSNFGTYRAPPTPWPVAGRLRPPTGAGGGPPALGSLPGGPLAGGLVTAAGFVGAL